MISESEPEQIGRTEGLIAGAKAIGRSDRKNHDLIAALARGASSRNVLLADDELSMIAEMEGAEFFEVQIILREVIPHLTVTAFEVMRLVKALVDKGGDDLAANQPNAAFREWCAADERRSDEVIAAARGGDVLSQEHLVFALQAKDDPDEAFRSADASGAEQTAGVLALSRMTLDAGQSACAVELILAAAEKVGIDESASLVKAALDIASKAPEVDRAGFASALERLAASKEPIAVHLIATAIYWHGAKMTDTEISICLKGLLDVDPKNGGTVRQINDALEELWSSRPIEVSETLFNLLSVTEGEIGNEALGRILSRQKNAGDDHRARIVTAWLLSGDFHACSALGSHISEINRKTPCLEVSPDVLPEDAADQVFVCRKAIGHFFLSPMTAASWIVAVLRREGAACDDVAELLFDPLLLNYGGALQDWLEQQTETDAPGNDAIRTALSRAQVVWDGFDAAREVVELQPSSGQRGLVRFQEAQDAERMHEAARENSIFADVFTTQTLLYGDRSSFSIMDDKGKRRPQTVNMAEMSVSSELPRGLIFDPVGTEWLLEVFRHEQKVSK
ncbi:hypothetical protein [uncultured Sulfitobacter sp.]|uniref:hypothetical protein n=1 Tax=uncultured Sulfitobacter sp. TaxID=191468 RepID=UPI002634989A|nr:hypothetical protein [uncultured Sulfitobacter sp.]